MIGVDPELAKSWSKRHFCDKIIHEGPATARAEKGSVNSKSILVCYLTSRGQFQLLAGGDKFAWQATYHLEAVHKASDRLQLLLPFNCHVLNLH